MRYLDIADKAGTIGAEISNPYICDLAKLVQDMAKKLAKQYNEAPINKCNNCKGTSNIRTRFCNSPCYTCNGTGDRIND